MPRRTLVTTVVALLASLASGAVAVVAITSADDSVSDAAAPNRSVASPEPPSAVGFDPAAVARLTLASLAGQATAIADAPVSETSDNAKEQAAATTAGASGEGNDSGSPTGPAPGPTTPTTTPAPDPTSDDPPPFDCSGSDDGLDEATKRAREDYCHAEDEAGD